MNDAPGKRETDQALRKLESKGARPEMCAPVIVSTGNARDLINGPGNPHLIWDGAEARVITEDFYQALHAESTWLLIITRHDLAEISPGTLTFHPATNAERLTMFASELAADYCPCPSHQLARPR